MKCPTCTTELTPGSQGAIGVELKKYIEETYGWDKYPQFKEGDTFSFGNYVAEVVKAKTNWEPYELDEPRYGLTQGDTFEVCIIFKVGDFFYKKTGSGDSYGELNWNGDFTPVEAKPRIVTVYEF